MEFTKTHPWVFKSNNYCLISIISCLEKSMSVELGRRFAVEKSSEATSNTSIIATTHGIYTTRCTIRLWVRDEVLIYGLMPYST